ncbi:type II secretion system protein [Thalassomonas actiniarum]|uniref:Type II secretion system protein n=1 Tax=Thalassomonas actiniarum TaxID=485447 RepID=A0AAE9YUC9_9GAMM|nr:type II secretion system protein [Thalassomonas actiniarum]WDE00519.1 type II secretion system protein [Thalassomonas actiniarum]
MARLKVSGFTLIELMIVMSIVALLMGMVGPLAIQNLEKAQSKSELMSVKNWLKQVSFQAYISGQELKLVLKGKEAKLVKTDSEEVLTDVTFEFLFFQPQTLNFNNKGYVTPTQLTGAYRNKPLLLDLKQPINGEYDIAISEF